MEEQLRAIKAGIEEKGYLFVSANYATRIDSTGRIHAGYRVEYIYEWMRRQRLCNMYGQNWESIERQLGELEIVRETR